jgi:hypothetical protein
MTYAYPGIFSARVLGDVFGRRPCLTWPVTA